MGDQVAGTVLIERYALEDRIGVGGMASVYRAIDLTTGSRVAVKILNRELLSKNPKEADRNIMRFRREGEILKQLAGEPYIVQFIEQGVTPAGDHFIAMELLEGEQLRFYIGRGKAAMGLRTFAYYAKHLIRGLMGIHERNLIHRDLAPDNIVIVKTREGLPWPKFLDFGIGKSLEGQVDHVTQMLTIMGKPQYFSPEQARGQELTFKSDIYALGVVLYEMATGSVPLEVHGMADLRKVQKEAPPPITSYREGCRLPEDLQALIMQCLEKEPDDRPSLEEVLAAVEQFSERLDAGEEFPMPATASGHSPTRGSAAAGPAGAEGTSGRAIGEFSEGDTIGRFRVRERIGRGGMGHVYLAWDPVLLRDVAIKVATRVEGEKARRAILREARASSHLKSDNIVTIYDAGIEAGCPYIAMEYVRGKTLAQIIEEEGPLSGTRFVSLARGILDGLSYAHEGESPVIHRDLKPANILCAGEVAKITDFGIATVTAAQHLAMSAHDTTTGGTSGAGSVYTISPEQANNKPADHRSDVYALGCILYMMVTGRPPFQGNQIAVLYQHVTKPPTPPIKLNPALAPAGLNAIILKCLEKEPTNRYQSVREVKADFEQLVGVARAGHPWHKSPLVLTSLAAIALTGVAIAYALLSRKVAGGTPALSISKIANVPVRPGQDSYLTNARELSIDLTSPVAGQVRATVTGEGIDRVVQVYPVPAGKSTTIGVPLPEGRDEPSKFLVTLERVDDPEQASSKLTVLQDLEKPRIGFKAYGQILAPTIAPIRVVRINDLSAVIDDDGGFDDDPSAKHIDLSWKDVHDSATLSRSKDSQTEGLFKVKVVAKDRAGNMEAVSQAVQVLQTDDMDVVIRKPLQDAATRSKTVDVEMVARLKDPKLKIPGLDEKDLDLGTGSFAARLEYASRQLPPVTMKRVAGGYVASLELPADMPEEADFDVVIEFEHEHQTQAHHRIDRLPPVITAQCGRGLVTSATKSAEVPALYADVLEPQGGAVVCRIDDGPAGVLGAKVRVGIGDRPPEPVPIGPDGRFSLPASDAEEFKVRIEGEDQAGNLAKLEFRVIRKGFQITSVRVAGIDPDAEGRFFVKDDRVAVRLAATGVSDEDSAYVMLLDENDRELDTAKLDRVPGEPQAFEAPELRLSPEGAGFVVRKLRFMFGKEPGEAQAFHRDLVLVYDPEPPVISVTIEDGTEEIREGEERKFGRLPSLKVRITDNVALASTDPAALVSWTRSDRSGPDVVVVPSAALATSRFGASGVTLTIERERVPEAPAANTFAFRIQARDRTTRDPTVRSFSVVVVPSEVEITTIADHADFARFKAPATPMLLNRDSVPFSVRPPLSSAGRCTLIVKASAEDGTEDIKRFPLESEEGVRSVDLVMPLPKSADARLIERGRLVFLLEEAGNLRPDERATVYYLLDREAPKWEISRNGRPVPEAERLELIKVAALSSLKIVVKDGNGSGFVDDSVKDPKEAARIEERTSDRIVLALRDDDTFRVSHYREVVLRVYDAAGNVTEINLRLARSKERLEVRLLTDDGKDPILRNEVLVVKRPALTFLVDNEAVGFDGVKWVVKRADHPIREGFVALKESEEAAPAPIAWEAAPGAEPYSIEFYASRPGGIETEPFYRVRVLVDTQGPSIYLRVGDHKLGKDDRPTIKDFGDLRVEFADSGSDLGGADFATVEITKGGVGGVAVPASLKPSRDGASWLIVPDASTVDGRYAITIRARDQYSNEDTKSFEVEVAASAAPSSRPAPEIRAGSRPTTNPSPRTVANTALREKDEERTGVKLVPVWATPDKSGPPRFFMSQTEVTNEQFLRFVDALLKDQIPAELRWRPDQSSTRKRVEAMRSRFDDFRRDPALPVVEVDSDVAQAFAAWTGGRLPSKEEWAGAAGRYLVKDAVWPVYVDHGTPKSGEFWMRDPGFANFQGSREARRQPVTELLRYSANAPFNIVGFAGNVAEWVTAEPGGRKVLGTLGGSFKYSYTNDVNNPRLDREPRLSPADAGIRVLWPAQVKAP